MTSPTNHQSSHESDCPYNYGHNCCCLGKPDSQAGDELQDMIDFLLAQNVPVETITIAASYGILYAERLAAERAVAEHQILWKEAIVPHLTNADDSIYIPIRDAIDKRGAELRATLTKETEHHDDSK